VKQFRIAPAAPGYHIPYIKVEANNAKLYIVHTTEYPITL